MNKKRFTLLFLSLLLTVAPLIGWSAPAQAAETDFSVDAKAAIAVDAESGKILYDQDGATPHEIASVSKIIGAYIVLEQVKEGKLSWDDQVSISDYAAELSVAPDLSNVPLHKELTYTVKSLFHASLIQSGNAAIVALGEKIAGSEPKFVDMMKAQLKKWNITDETLVNASGLNNSYLGDNLYPGSSSTDENKLSAKDVAIVARHLITDYPEVLDITSTATEEFGEGTYSPVTMINWNWMLPGFVSYKEGVDGLKTGTTDKAGACFVGTIKKDDRRIITVVLNVNGHDTDHSVRFTQTAKLMDYALDNWTKETISLTGKKIDGTATVKVKDGKESSVAVSMTKDVTVWVPKDADTSALDLKTTLDDKVVTSEGVEAPVKKGTAVGTVSVSLKSDPLGYLDDTKIPTTTLATSESIAKASAIVLGWRKVTNFFKELF